jgi:hypothetical protein
MLTKKYGSQKLFISWKFKIWFLYLKFKFDSVEFPVLIENYVASI